MEEKKHKQIIYAIIGVLFFFTMLSQCNSRSAKNYADENGTKIDSALVIINAINKDKANTKDLSVLLKIEGLKTEKSTLLNTNQIFLTNKRPDERVIEIDKEIERLENLK
jgi:hypothetical protein